MISGIVGCVFLHDNSGGIRDFARVLDGLIACALLIIGGCGIRWEFMPSYLAPALLGAGTIYGIWSILLPIGNSICHGYLIKHQTQNNSSLFLDE